MKLTAIFRGCKQIGMDTWVDYAKTRDIPLMDDQIKLLTVPKGMSFLRINFRADGRGEKR